MWKRGTFSAHITKSCATSIGYKGEGKFYYGTSLYATLTQMIFIFKAMFKFIF